ncbi:MAG: hypothetical protein AAFR79_07875, partial [Pseudomonadota bacterium]
MIRALLLLGLLAGCTAGGPLPAPSTASTLAPPAETIEGAAGPLALSRWGPEAPEAVILALHGFGDYGPSTFGRAAEAWADV